MLSVEELAARKTGIGGSDIGAVLGLSPYATPLDVYNDKLGLVEPEDLSANEAVHFGNVLEDVVAAEFARRTRLKVRRSNQLLVHAEHEILKANIDRSIVGKVAGLKAGLECKTCDRWAAKPELWGPGSTFSWDDEGNLVIDEPNDQVPESYLMQCVHYMAVTDSDIWFLAVLIGGNQFRIYTIFRDRELEALAVDGALNFWNFHVLPGIPPKPTNQRDLESLFAQDNGTAIYASPDALAAYVRAKEIQAQMKALEVELDGVAVGGTKLGGLKNVIRGAIGENAELLLDGEDKPIATWKNSKPSKRFDQAAFKKAHPKLYREFSNEQPGPRVLLLK